MPRMPVPVYCTYFDHNYLSRGLVMIRSLRRHQADARVWVLALSAETATALTKLDEPGVTVVEVTEFEREMAPIADLRRGRTPAEYLFTCTVALVRYVMARVPDDDWVTYLDGDLGFFNSPEPIYAELAGSSVGIIPHRFPAAQGHRARYGTYNVGWVSFRHDSAGRRCAEWWDDRCREWCHDRVEDGKFADQGYLDRFPEVCDAVRIIGNPGANLAPWNLAGHELRTRADGHVLVDGAPLVFFHFHGVTRRGDRYYFKHVGYRARTTGLVRDRIYRPYLTELDNINREVEHLLSGRETGGLRRGSGMGIDLVGPAKSSLLRLVARARRDTLRLPAGRVDR